MAHTRTGSFPIGFRRGWSDWQKNLADVVAFAKANDFSVIDVGDLPAEQIKPILSAGLKVGSVDLKSPWQAIAAADAGKRKEAVAAAAEHVKSVSALGVRNFFTVVFPADDAGDRKTNFKHAVAGYAELARAIAPSGTKIVIEGYPGGHPHFAALCCTPEGYRAFFKETGSDVLGINFDPSHLIRMGIDSARFAREFASRIFHVHGKDTELFPEALYEFGNTQLATLAPGHGFGAWTWRYTIPGHGVAPWPTLLAILKQAGYSGAVSIELEDENFNGATESEQRGLLASRDFLVNA